MTDKRKDRLALQADWSTVVYLNARISLELMHNFSIINGINTIKHSKKYAKLIS